MDIDALSKRFNHFGKQECKGSSRLYENLSMNIAEDAKLLQIASYAGLGQPIPNLFFGAVQFLLLKGNRHELSEYYGSIVANPRDCDTAYPHFKDFCNQYKNEIISILQSKLVQTNEVRRCAYLYPSFCYIYEIAEKPLSLIEIGTSAGLQLLWDQYSYSYNTGKEAYGNLRSSVHIKSEIRGDVMPLLHKMSPPVVSRHVWIYM